MKVKHSHSALKSILWRILGVIILATITYIVTRKLITTTYITLVHHATFLVVFYLHERVWLLLKRDIGKKKNLIKALTYEVVLGMGIGGLIVYLFTGKWSQVTLITPIYTAIKIITYYFYDQIWEKYERKN